MKHTLFLIIALLLLTACSQKIETGIKTSTLPVYMYETPIATANTSDTPLNIPDTKNWKLHSLPVVGLTLKLPPKLDSLGQVKQEIAAGETGSQLCVQFDKSAAWYVKLIPEVEAGGGCGTTPNGFISAGTTSTDYTAGRGGTFMDMQGFVKKDGKYLNKFVNSAENESFTQDRIIPVNNPNGVEIIKIKGGSFAPDDGPTISNSLGDNTGALINTKMKKYPGLTIVFQPSLTDKEIDGILFSINFIK
ncbi:MAG: hypothetical protein M3Q44_06840 [bacterium]|nr:hypothetical protein [bacterium]